MTTFDAAAHGPFPVAIVGAGCRLPGGVGSLNGLWEVLDEGRDVVGTVPADRFDVTRFVSGGVARPGKSYTAAGGFLDDVAGFDAEFFGMSPKEASRVDPQQRLVLECAVEALDDAGIASEGLAGSDAPVVIGVSTHDYADLQARRTRTTNPYTMSGSAACNTANRVSYVLDLRGESLAVDTACSSALVAVHRACELLRRGHGDLALAGGANVLLGPMGFAGFSHASMLSPTGRCRPFSARADGFTRAEGAGVVVLKPLAKALADGDRVHAVITASGVNSDGRTAGLALPNPDAQAELLERVYAEAGLRPDDVAYVEAHGTGTQAGDPVECAALGRVLGRHRAAPLAIGSVKSNLGHLEAASGVAGLLKALLVLRERRIPATLHLEEPNSAIDFAGLGLDPVDRARPLPGDRAAAVGVSSFGFGGVNAHLVLTGAPRPPESARPSGRLPILVTARTTAALAEAARRWADTLEDTAPERFYDVAHTSCLRRGKHEHRIAVLATGPRDAARILRSSADGDPTCDGASARAVAQGRIGFVFDGNGSQWVGMGRALLADDPAFRAEVAALDALLAPVLGWSVTTQLSTPDAQLWSRTEVAQPLLFAVQAGLVAALAARGITPAAVTGHSVGEVAAAHCAGVLDRAAACRVIVERSRAQARTAGTGRMAAVGSGAEDAERLIRDGGHTGRVSVAAVNSPRDTTVSGDAAALAELGELARRRGVFFRDLELDYPFHSPVMDPLRADLDTALADLDTRSGRIPLVSTVTGKAVDGAAVDAEHWWRNLREPVLFADAVTTLVEGLGCDVLVEIGPHPALGAYLRRTTADRPEPVAIVPTTSRAVAGAQALDTARAKAVAVGAEVDWDAFFPEPGRVADLPAYPWQRERHWNGRPDWWLEGAAHEQPRRRHPLLGDRQPGPDPLWRCEIGPESPAWQADHRVGDTVVLPAAAHLDLVLAAGREVFDGPVELLRVAVDRALPLPDDTPVELHTTIGRDAGFTVAARAGDGADWTDHARGRVRRLLRDRPPALDVRAVEARLLTTVTADEHYAACARIGLPYGPAFRVLDRLLVGEGEVLARYTATLPVDGPHPAHPTLLDGGLQAVFPLAAGVDPVPHLPVGFDAVRSWAPMPATGLVHVRLRAAGSGEIRWDLTVTGTDGAVALEVLGCRARRFDGARPERPQRLVETLRARPLPGTPAEPSPLPAPPAVLAGAASRLAALSDRWSPRLYRRLRARSLELTAHFTAAALRELLPDAPAVTFPDLAAAGVLPGHHRVLTVLIGVATRHGLLTETAPGVWAWGTEPAPAELLRTSLDELPTGNTFLHAYGVCGLHLADVLRGRCDPLELLFAEPDALAARMYDSSGPTLHHNAAVAELVRVAVRDWPADRPLRVLEVGAGTGGLTASVLPLLPADRTHYTFTDISPVFIPQAEERFAGYGFVDHRVLDLDADPAGQGFTPGSFDLVLAANVLHATRDLASALRHVRGLLAEGGQLVVLESHDLEVYALIFGLLDSFWGIRDTDLRPDGPMPTRDRWPALLSDCGFAGITMADDWSEGIYSVFLATRGDRPTLEQPPGRVDEGQRWLIGRLPGTSPLTAIESAVVAAVGTAFAGAEAHDVDDDPATWTALVAGTPGPVDVVLSVGFAEPDPSDDGVDQVVRHCAVLRALVTACAQLPGQVKPTLWLVVPARHGAAPELSPVAAAVWGAARTLANEQPQLAVRRIALVGSGDALAGHLVRELRARSEEDEVLLTASGRFVPRLRPLPRPTTPARTGYTLDLVDHGLRYDLRWRTAVTPAPGPGEVVIRVEAAALNYRDVLIATGLVPSSPRAGAGTTEIGLECAGEVEAVGADVTRFAPGDRVACLTTGCFGSHVAAPVARVLPVPSGMTCAEAVTLPVVALTVQRGLHDLARLAEGETLLVHGAAGGVGLAALQHARHVGARVIATAGSPAKRDLLRLLGAEHVLNSRSAHFADQVRDLTGGRGVDVVLNSLAGEALVRGVEALAPGGRFVELGKRDFHADTSLPLAPFLDNLSFFGVDVMGLLEEPDRVADGIAFLAEAIDQGIYRPLPHRTYPADRVKEAFTHLQHSRHVGKVVVTFDGPVPVERPTTVPGLDGDAAYLITGGLSGIGAATARHLADRGARHLVLVSRRGAASPEAGPLLADLAALGVRVEAHAADAADPAAMRAILDDLDASGRRLAGVVHSAMVLRDAPLTDLSDDDLRAVLRPKPGAGHLLDRLTRHRALDFFVVHSSIAACVGNFRQVPYVAANAAMEALVRDRRRAGLPGLAVQWGSVTDTGAAHHSGQIEQLGQVFGKLPVAEALREQDDLLCHPEVDVVAVGRFRWDRLSRVLPTLTAPRTAALLPTREDTTAADRVRGALAGADPARALPLIEQVLVELLARVLQTPADRIAPDRRLDQLGVDSLMAAEFTTLVHRHLDCYLPAVELAGTPTLTALAHRVHARLGHAAPGGSAEEDRRGAAEPR